MISLRNYRLAFKQLLTVSRDFMLDMASDLLQKGEKSNF